MQSLEKMLDQEMRDAAAAMDFELAAQLRDQLFELRARGSNAGSKQTHQSSSAHAASAGARGARESDA